MLHIVMAHLAMANFGSEILIAYLWKKYFFLKIKVDFWLFNETTHTLEHKQQKCNCIETCENIIVCIHQQADTYWSNRGRGMFQEEFCLGRASFGRSHQFGATLPLRAIMKHYQKFVSTSWTQTLRMRLIMTRKQKSLAHSSHRSHMQACHCVHKQGRSNQIN